MTSPYDEIQLFQVHAVHWSTSTELGPMRPTLSSSGATITMDFTRHTILEPGLLMIYYLKIGIAAAQVHGFNPW